MALGCAYSVYGGSGLPPDTVFYLGRDTFRTPVYAFYGLQKGPVMVLDAGIHGDEVAGQYACDSLVANISIQKGTLYIIPRTNREACFDTIRFVNRDLNRTFPGDTCWVDYEYTLSYMFMQLIDSLRPNLVINLHEARAHTKTMTPKNKNDKAFGNTLIYVGETKDHILTGAQYQINRYLSDPEEKFTLHDFPFMAAGSLDNMYYRLGIKSFTVETWRGYDLPFRVCMQTAISLEFMRQLGIGFTINGQH
jgi:predicted deacylase